jgi:hypothetical protein
MAGYNFTKPTFKQCDMKALDRDLHFLKMDEPYNDGLYTYRYSLEDDNGNIKLCKNLMEVWDELNAGVK